MARCPLIGCVVLTIAGCSPAVVRVEPQPVAVTLVQWNDAAATARALEAKPYLKLRQQELAPVLQKHAGADAGARASQAALQRVRADLTRARELYRQMQFSDAVPVLRQAQAALAPHAASAEHFKLLSQLALEQGLNHLALKDEAAAREAIITASIHGHQGPAPGALPPQVEQFINRVRGELAGLTSGSLSVATQPAGAGVVINGKPRGVAPITVRLTPGLHHLRVEQLGFAAEAVLQRVSPGKVERAQIYLKPAAAATSARQLLALRKRGGDPTSSPGSVQRVLGPRRALLVTNNESGLTGHLLWTGGGGSALREERCKVRHAQALADCLGPRLYRLATGKAYQVKQLHAPVYKRWWFWALVGGGVAAATGTTLGIYYGTRPADGRNVDLELQ